MGNNSSSLAELELKAENIIKEDSTLANMRSSDNEQQILNDYICESDEWNQTCQAAHFKGLPSDLKRYLERKDPKLGTGKTEDSALELIMKGRAVILEYLPYDKRVRALAAVESGFLTSIFLSEVSRTLILTDIGLFPKLFRRRIPSLAEVLRGRLN